MIQNTLAERQQTHGNFPDQATTAQRLKDIHRESPNWETLSPAMKESLDLIATKVSRILHGNPKHSDTWHDVAGYATLIERVLQA